MKAYEKKHKKQYYIRNPTKNTSKNQQTHIIQETRRRS